MQLLLIESSKSYSSVFQKLLERSSVDITIATTLEQAKEQIEHRVFDIIFSSSLLEEHSATVFCTHLRESTKNSQTPYIIYATNVTDERQQEYQSLGASELISKTNLIENLRGYIEKHQTHVADDSSNTVNIVHIEDDRVMQILMKNYLARIDDIHLSQFTLGKEGIAYIGDHCPDILLLDMNLPDLNGWEIAAALNEMEHSKNFPIIAVTGEKADDSNSRGDANLFAEVIQKPFNQETIEQIVARFR